MTTYANTTRATKRATNINPVPAEASVATATTTTPIRRSARMRAQPFVTSDSATKARETRFG